jgi:hypothetical protein
MIASKSVLMSRIDAHDCCRPAFADDHGKAAKLQRRLTHETLAKSFFA